METLRAFNVPLLLVAILSGAIIAAALAHAFFTKNKTRVMRLAIIGAAGAALYGAVLLYVSLSAETVELPRGTAKRFCGFYLDCHMSCAVETVTATQSLGQGEDTIHTTGMFYVITLRIASDAHRVNMGLYNVNADLIDGDNRHYSRNATAEEIIRKTSNAELSLERVVHAGDSYVATLVYDVPAGTSRLRLDVTTGHPIDRLLEIALIGDTDSFLHPPTLLSLD